LIFFSYFGLSSSSFFLIFLGYLRLLEDVEAFLSSPFFSSSLLSYPFFSFTITSLTDFLFLAYFAAFSFSAQSGFFFLYNSNYS